MLQQLVWFLHVMSALCIIILVLLQYGKGAEMGAAMSGGASQTIFGSRGSGSFLTKLTTIFALVFAITSISLSLFINNQSNNKTISDLIAQEENQGSEMMFPIDEERSIEENDEITSNVTTDLNDDLAEPLLDK